MLISIIRAWSYYAVSADSNAVPYFWPGNTYTASALNKDFLTKVGSYISSSFSWPNPVGDPTIRVSAWAGSQYA